MCHASSVHDRVVALLAEALHLEVPSAETDLFETGILDSLTFVEVLLLLEREFGVATALEDLEADNFRSIGRIAEFIARRTTPTDLAQLPDVAAALRVQQ